MSAQPVQTHPADLPSVISARSLIHGKGHPSQASRLSHPWRLEVRGRMFGVRRAQPADLPGVMAALVRSSALTRWQWRGNRGGAVPSISAMAAWLREPGNLVVLAPPVRELPARIVGLAGLGELACASPPSATAHPGPPPAATPVPYAAVAEVMVADPWQHLGIGRAMTAHLAASAWLLGRRELYCAQHAEVETGSRLIGAFGMVRSARHDHGAHPFVRLSADVLVGLGPLRTAGLG
jgi:ribosomal protein S18 acetylase RimI-like enzyme